MVENGGCFDNNIQDIKNSQIHMIKIQNENLDDVEMRRKSIGIESPKEKQHSIDSKRSLTESNVKKGVPTRIHNIQTEKNDLLYSHHESKNLVNSKQITE